MSWLALTAVHLAATGFLAGLIWTIQLVHYPSFDRIADDGYAEFQQEHMAKMGVLVGPPWLVEGLTVLAVFFFAPTTTDRLLATVGGVLEAVAIGVTVMASIPAHDRLTRGFSAEAHERLVRTNWMRTAAWTARLAIAVALVVRAA